MPAAAPQGPAPALGDLAKAPVKFSSHAAARLTSRGIDMGAEQMRKLGEAVDKAAAKGLDETLILTKDAAFIVSVKNRTVVTAMDKSQLEGNVFTNIEGAVIVS
jgi:flagellar operon protein